VSIAILSRHPRTNSGRIILQVSTAKLDHPIRSAPRATPARLTASRPTRESFIQRVEAFISRLSTRNNFWQKACSLIWLPFAFRSGITMKRLGTNRFSAVLPFRRFNRNWYNVMAGAALLGNSEVAGGMYLFSECGSDYIVMCKELRYQFLRPCRGPAVYHVVNSDDLPRRIAAGGEFNIDLELEIRQQIKMRGKEFRVGRCQITFHCTPKAQLRQRSARHKSK
ncbi:MAG: hypothetical protein O6941_01060, partial [Planctomycetota bacterium]|nr:hypothetical protein [Planctomycetota bacterium]